MKYALSNQSGKAAPEPGYSALKRLLPLLRGAKRNLAWAGVTVVIGSAGTLAAPYVIGRTIDGAIRTKDFHGVLLSSVLLLGIYLVVVVTGYVQTICMGTVGRHVLFSLRNLLFSKLQELPVAFFNQNKSGDLISRINNDTEKLNQFFAQGIVQFVRSFFMMLGTGIFLIALNPKLGLAALGPAAGVLVLTRLISPWVKRKNTRSLQTTGGLSAEIQESLSNFKVIVAFNRLDYFRQKFSQVNEQNFKSSVGAGLANGIFVPIYGLASSSAQLIVLAYGIALITSGHMTIGLLIGFLLYVDNFYMPLRQVASIWSTFQLALAAVERVSEVLAMESDMALIPAETLDAKDSKAVMEFRGVSFRYDDGKNVLRDVNFALEAGKTYALVGPTGGGKTTTASLMARLYDPSEGTVLLSGRDIRSYAPEERAKKVGFILQEPFLFSGSVLDNIFYGNAEFVGAANEQKVEAIRQAGLGNLLARFERGFDVKIETTGDGISLGQRQLIAFMRAVLRKPEFLVLDEATANIDTVTEQLLEETLRALPKSTTKVIIAHRLNTIESADEIFFVNGGELVRAGSLQNAVDMLMKGKRES
jgi:ATP-binding cassette subfamily B protein